MTMKETYEELKDCLADVEKRITDTLYLHHPEGPESELAGTFLEIAKKLAPIRIEMETALECYERDRELESALAEVKQMKIQRQAEEWEEVAA
jgi:hypothetical protein